jgi:hypothetical protein
MMRGPQGHVLNRLFVREKGFSIRYCSRSLAFPFTRQTKYWEIIADKARQIAAMMVKASSITSSDVSTYFGAAE